jgi:NTE family protein
MTDATTLALDNPNGYERTPELQAQFAAAAESLRVHDGWADPTTGQHELRADLVLEGGGVKASGLVGAVMVLSEAGYSIRATAGTSAGAVVASLVAGVTQAGKPMSFLLERALTLDFKRFMMPNGKIHEFFDRATGKVGTMLADMAILTDKTGLYSGAYLEDWLRPILHDELGIKTFADLKLTPADDPDLSLAPGRDYRLVVMTSDITRGQVARLPWDYPLYGHDPDSEDPVDAVRASMSIPFIFEPVHFVSREATGSVTGPGGVATPVHYAAGTHTWVDGSLLENFPIHAFDRVDAQPARWPTIGVKLSSLTTEFPAAEACGSALEVAMHCLRATMSDWDANALHERTASRTIYVDNAGLSAADFDLPKSREYELFLNGVRAATDFIIASAAAGGVPRN